MATMTFAERIAAAKAAVAAKAAGDAPVPAAPEVKPEPVAPAPAAPVQVVAPIPAVAENVMATTPEHNEEVPKPVAKLMTFAEKMAQRKATAALQLPKVAVADTPSEKAIVKVISPTPSATVRQVNMVPPVAAAATSAEQPYSDIKSCPNELTSLSENTGTEYSFRELLNMLTDTPDIILTMPTDQIPELRQGLAARKAKDTQRLAKDGIQVEPLSLSFLVYLAKDNKGIPLEGQSNVRVKLAPRKGVTIYSIKIPDDTF